MLIVKVFVNKEKIDEIRIQNVGEYLHGNNNWYYYKIIKPQRMEKLFLHRRADGYRRLLAKALNWLIKNKEEE